MQAGCCCQQLNATRQCYAILTSSSRASLLLVSAQVMGECGAASRYHRKPVAKSANRRAGGSGRARKTTGGVTGPICTFHPRTPPHFCNATHLLAIYVRVPSGYLARCACSDWEEAEGTPERFCIIKATSAPAHRPHGCCGSRPPGRLILHTLK